MYIEDVVEADMLALNSQNCVGEVINVGTGKPTTVNELAKVLMETFRKTYLKLEYAALRAGDIRNSFADISKAERVLGYKPRIKLEEGIKCLLQGLDAKTE